MRLVRTTVSQPFCVMASSGAANCPPALLTRPSMRPCGLRMSPTVAYGLLLANIAGVAGGPPAILGDLGLHAAKLLRLAPDEGDGGTEARQLVCGAPADAAAASSDDQRLSGKQSRPKNRPVAAGPSPRIAHQRFFPPAPTPIAAAAVPSQCRGPVRRPQLPAQIKPGGSRDPGPHPQGGYRAASSKEARNRYISARSRSCPKPLICLGIGTGERNRTLDTQLGK